MPAYSSSTAAYSLAATALASLPICIYVRDRMFGICRVHGSSMEPSLQSGDVVLVRKLEPGTLFSNYDEDQEQLVSFERLQGMNTGKALMWTSPPLVLPGHILVYQNPLCIDREYLIKRVVGVGGQWLKQEVLRSRPVGASSGKRRNVKRVYDYRMEALQPFTVYVEGDNKQSSVSDSKDLGAISRHHAIGVAQYVIWPPTRIQRLRRIPELDQDGKPRAIWY